MLLVRSFRVNLALGLLRTGDKRDFGSCARRSTVLLAIDLVLSIQTLVQLEALITHD